MMELRNSLNGTHNTQKPMKHSLIIVHKSYSYAPKTKGELRDIIEERLADDPNADLNDIDVSGITDMSNLFYGLDPYNIDISKWDVSNVQHMLSIFWGCKNFNSDLSGWDVSNVENMGCMFCKRYA